MERNLYQPDFKPFLKYVEDELDHLEAFDLASDYLLVNYPSAKAKGLLER